MDNLRLTDSDLGTKAEDFIPESLPPAATAPPRAFLLTGATGFLGSHLARALLAVPDVTVHCLVRGKSDDEAARRLLEHLAGHGLWAEEMTCRINVIRGDLASPRFGLRMSEFEAIAYKIDSVVHAGSIMNSFLPYRFLAEANVQGTAQLLKLATIGQLKPFHYVSSVSADPAGPYFRESGYAQSKWRAEQLIALAHRHGVPTAICRLPRISGATGTGYWNDNDTVARLLRAVLVLGQAPDLDFEEDWVPVDIAAGILAELAAAPAAGERRVLAADSPVRFSRILTVARQAGRAIDLVPAQDWLTALHDHKLAEYVLIQPSLTAPAAPRSTGRHGFRVITTAGVTDDLLRQYIAALTDMLAS
jgi:nonribosomal peptide synthetase DhbF